MILYPISILWISLSKKNMKSPFLYLQAWLHPAPFYGLPEARQLHRGERTARRVPQQKRQGVWRLAEKGSDLQGRTGIIGGNDGYTMAAHIYIYISPAF